MRLRTRIRRIKKRTNVIDVARRVGVEIPENEELVPCPFHAETDGSFHVHKQGQRWKCFGCGKGGDAIDFLAEFRGCSLEQATAVIEADIGLADPDPRWVLDNLATPRAPESATENLDVVVEAVERFIVARLVPYRRCPIVLVVELSDPYIDYVWECFDETRFVVLNSRDREAKRELRAFGKWVVSMLRLVERVVHDSLSLDRSDVEFLAPDPVRTPEEIEACSDLLRFLARSRSTP
jgi:hypothetical protein